MDTPPLLSELERKPDMHIHEGTNPSVRPRNPSVRSSMCNKICWLFCKSKKKAANVNPNEVPHELVMQNRHQHAAVQAAGNTSTKGDNKRPGSVNHGPLSGTASGGSVSQQVNHNPSGSDHATPASDTIQHGSASRAMVRQPSIASQITSFSPRHSQFAPPLSTTQDMSELQYSERLPSVASQGDNAFSENRESPSRFTESNCSTSQPSTEISPIVNQGEIELPESAASVFPSSPVQEGYTSPPPMSSSSIATPVGNEISVETQCDLFSRVEQDEPVSQIENELTDNIAPAVASNAAFSRPAPLKVDEKLSEDSTSASPPSIAQDESSPPPSLGSSSIDSESPGTVSSVSSYSSESESPPPTSSSSTATQVNNEPADSSNFIPPSGARQFNSTSQQSATPFLINTQLGRQFSSNNKCILTPTIGQDEDNSKSILSPGTVQGCSETLYLRRPSQIIALASNDPSPSDSSTPLEAPRAPRTVQDTDAMYQSYNLSSQALNWEGRLTPIRTVQDTQAMEQITQSSSNDSEDGQSSPISDQTVASSVSQPITSGESQRALSTDTQSDVSADTQSGSSAEVHSVSSGDIRFYPSSDNQSVSSYDSRSFRSCDIHDVPSDTEEDRVLPPPLTMAEHLPALPEERINGHIEHDFPSEQSTLTTEEHEPDLQGMPIPGTNHFDGQIDPAHSQRDDARLDGVARSLSQQEDPDDAQAQNVQAGELPPPKGGSPVRICAYSPEGQFLAVGVKSGDIVIYNASNWELFLRLRGHRLSVLSLDFSPNGERLASADWSSTLRLWDVASGETLLIMKGHRRRVQSLAFSPRGTQIASASHYRTVRLWCSKFGDCLSILEGHTSNVTKVAYMPKGRRLVSCSDDGMICIWNTETGEALETWGTPRLYVRCITISANGRQGALASGYKQSRIQLLNMDTGELGLVLENSGETTCIAFSPNGQWIASFGRDNTIRMWDISSGQLVTSFSVHVSKVSTCTFSPDGLEIASGDSSGSLRLWDVTTADTVSKFDSGEALVVAFASDRRHILSCRRHQFLELWDSLTGAVVPLPYEMTVDVCTFSISPTGGQFATGCLDGSIRLWRDHDYTVERSLPGHIVAIVKLDYSPCARWLVSCDQIGTVRLWDLHFHNDSKEIETRTGNDTFKDVVFRPIGHEFSAISGCSVHLYDPRERDPCASVHEIILDSPMYPFDYSKDGRRLVFGSCLGSHSVYVKDPESQCGDCKLEGHDQEILCAVFSPCGTRILTGSGDKTVRLWSSKVDSWSCISVVRGFSEAITCLAWNPVVPTDFVTGCQDGSVRVWRISIAGARGNVSIALVWGSGVGRLIVPTLTFKETSYLDPIDDELLVQPSAINNSLTTIKQSNDSSIQRDILLYLCFFFILLSLLFSFL